MVFASIAWCLLGLSACEDLLVRDFVELGLCIIRWRCGFPNVISLQIVLVYIPLMCSVVGVQARSGGDARSVGRIAARERGAR